MHNNLKSTQPNNNLEYYIGLMSGTSLDGVDAVCVAYKQKKFKKVIGHYGLEYSAGLKKQLLALQNTQYNEIHISEIIAIELTHLYIESVQQLLKKIDLTHASISAIGCHGQTIRHCPEFFYSKQLANYALLAEKTQINVVGDFRSTDLVAQGQGAPLVPFFHQELFSHPTDTRVILNIGGIANITILNPKTETVGFDTGPGNMLLDEWCRTYFDTPFDINGTYSKQGDVIHKLIEQFFTTSYFQETPPKSTGRDLFSKEWLNNFLTGSENPLDIARTLVELTSLSISHEIKKYAPEVKEIYVCGGGVYNNTLMHRLRELVTPAKVFSIAELHIHPMHVEASAFSWLAMKRIHREHSNLPFSTGAKGNRVLGALWEPFNNS